MNEENYKILTLDGGGSKGIYTLGVLSELEKHLGGKIHEHFNLIYGTSTGSIIASMLALGHSVEEVKEKYLELIPKIMGCGRASSKSKMLRKYGLEIFEEKDFNDFKTGIGIVAMNYDTQTPLVFKNEVDRAHGVKKSFAPGFGVKISDAIEASCAACPIFQQKKVNTTNKGIINAIDGGFIANNPTLFAMIDASKALNYDVDKIRILSLGVGNYIEKPISRYINIISKLQMAKIASRVLTASSNTTEALTKLLFPNLAVVRINDSFNQPEYGTNMVEKDKKKLEKMFQLGILSFAKFEKDIEKLLQTN